MINYLLITLFSWLLVNNTYQKIECFSSKDQKIHVTVIKDGKIIANDAYDVTTMMQYIDSRADWSIDQKIAERKRVIDIMQNQPCK